MIIRTFCLTLPENPDRAVKAAAHFKSVGLHAFQFFHGIHAEKAGLATVHPYEVDHPGSGFKMGYKPTGIWLGHVMLWSALTLVHEDHFLILEDDAKFGEGWHARFTQALRDAPADFDMLYVGSCCCKNKVRAHIKGEVFDVNGPMCTHAYVVAKKALPILLSTNRKCYAPVDVAMIFHSHPQMKVLTVLPRIAEQFDTFIPE